MRTSGWQGPTAKPLAVTAVLPPCCCRALAAHEPETRNGLCLHLHRALETRVQAVQPTWEVLRRSDFSGKIPVPQKPPVLKYLRINGGGRPKSFSQTPVHG